MENITETQVTEYIRNTLRRDERLEAIEAYALREHIPIIQREAGQLLCVLVALARPKRILELGTAIGYSALLMAHSCDARIVSIERDEERFCRALANIREQGMEERVRLIHGEAETELFNLPGTFDFIFIDAAKGQLPVHFELAVSKLAEGGVIVADNVLYRGLVAQDEVAHKHRTIATRLRAFLEELCADERFVTSVVPIGDGMAISKAR